MTGENAAVGEHPGQIAIDPEQTIEFATGYEFQIRAHEKTATVRYQSCEDVHRGDVVELQTEDGTHIDTVRVTRVSECRLDEALKHIDLWNARYPTDTIEGVVRGINRHYEDQIGVETTVRVVCWDPTIGGEADG